MATPEITLTGEFRDAVIGCVVRDIESSLGAVQADYESALQTFDCVDLLNARAHARSLANAAELLARLLDPQRVDQVIKREREVAELQQNEEGEPAVDDEKAPATAGAGARGSNWDSVDRTVASNWVGATAREPEFLQAPTRNGRPHPVAGS